MNDLEEILSSLTFTTCRVLLDYLSRVGITTIKLEGIPFDFMNHSRRQKRFPIESKIKLWVRERDLFHLKKLEGSFHCKIILWNWVYERTAGPGEDNFVSTFARLGLCVLFFLR